MLNTDDFGLVVVDIQGKLARIVHNSDSVIRQTQKLIQCCQALAIPIVVLEQNPSGLGHTVEELATLLAKEDVIEKHHFDGMQEDSVRRAILSKGKKNWLVAGIEAHICVYQTVLGLRTHNCTPMVLTDCIASRSQSNRDLAVTKLQQLGVATSSVEMSVYQLLGSSNHPAFKRILDIIK